MAAVRRDVRVVLTTRVQAFTPGTVDPGFTYTITGSGETNSVTTTETTITFPGVISGPHTVTVSKLGVTASADIVVPDDGNILVPVTVTLSVV